MTHSASKITLASCAPLGFLLGASWVLLGCLAIVLIGMKATYNVVVELLNPYSPVLGDVGATFSQLVPGAYKELRLGPPGTGKTTTSAFALLLELLANHGAYKGITHSTQNAGTAALTSTLYSITWDAPVIEMITRVLGHYAKEKERATQLDGNPSIAKESAESIYTDGLLLRMFGQTYSTIDWHNIARATKDELQMGLGAPSQEVLSLIHNALRTSGVSIKEAGDVYQQSGGRDTILQRTITRHVIFMHASGKYSHSGFAVLSTIIRKMEALMLQQGLAECMTEQTIMQRR